MKYGFASSRCDILASRCRLTRSSLWSLPVLALLSPPVGTLRAQSFTSWSSGTLTQNFDGWNLPSTPGTNVADFGSGSFGGTAADGWFLGKTNQDYAASGGAVLASGSQLQAAGFPSGAGKRTVITSDGEEGAGISNKCIKQFGSSASFGSGPTSDRALGAQSGGSNNDCAIEWRIKNTSGQSMGQFSVRYSGEQWRQHTVCPAERSKSQSIALAFARATTADPTSLTWTILGPEFQFSAPQIIEENLQTADPDITTFDGQTDVGTITKNYTLEADNTHTLTSTGTLSSGGTTSDSFFFLQESLAGNPTSFSFTCRMDSFTATDGNARAGIMLRNGTAANAAYVFVGRLQSGEVRVIRRLSNGAGSATGGTLIAAPSGTPPLWLNICRSGPGITASVATNFDNNTSDPTDDSPGVFLSAASVDAANFTAMNVGLVSTSNATANFRGPKVEFRAPEKLDGNLSANRRTNLGGHVILPTPVANNEFLFLRWLDWNALDEDHSLAIDDISFTAGPSVALARQPYVQSVTSTSAKILWKFTSALSTPWLRFRTATGSWQNATVTVESGVYVTATLSNLTAGTQYFYQLGHGTNTDVYTGSARSDALPVPPAPGAALTLKTDAGPKEPTSILILGDPGTRGKKLDGPNPSYDGIFNVHTALTRYLKENGAAGQDGKPFPDVALLDGDNVYNGDDDTSGGPVDSEAQQAAEMEAEFQLAIWDVWAERMKSCAFYPAVGNHDTVKNDNTDPVTGNVPGASPPVAEIFDHARLFAVPEHSASSPAGAGEKTFYSFDSGNVHIICLDSHTQTLDPGQAMFDWLEWDLQQNCRPWVIAFWHHPAYTGSSQVNDKKSRRMRQVAEPILEKYGVDLTITGHAHSYERSWPMVGFHETSGQNWDTMAKLQGQWKNKVDAWSTGNPITIPFFRDPGDLPAFPAAGLESNDVFAFPHHIYRKIVGVGAAGGIIHVVCGNSGTNAAVQTGLFEGGTPNLPMANNGLITRQGCCLIETSNHSGGRMRMTVTYIAAVNGNGGSWQNYDAATNYTILDGFIIEKSLGMVELVNSSPSVNMFPDRIGENGMVAGTSYAYPSQAVAWDLGTVLTTPSASAPSPLAPTFQFSSAENAMGSAGDRIFLNGNSSSPFAKVVRIVNGVPSTPVQLAVPAGCTASSVWYVNNPPSGSSATCIGAGLVSGVGKSLVWTVPVSGTLSGGTVTELETSGTATAVADSGGNGGAFMVGYKPNPDWLAAWWNNPFLTPPDGTGASGPPYSWKLTNVNSAGLAVDGDSVMMKWNLAQSPVVPVQMAGPASWTNSSPLYSTMDGWWGGVNNAGFIVWAVQDDAYDSKAVVWCPDGTCYTLDELFLPPGSPDSFIWVSDITDDNIVVAALWINGGEASKWMALRLPFAPHP